MAGSFDWKGGSVKHKAMAAAQRGVNVVMGKCVISAKDLVHVQYAVLQGSIRLEPATIQGDRVVGQWGSFDVGYAFWQEVLPASRGGKPYLRPSASKYYPTLKVEVKRAFG